MNDPEPDFDNTIFDYPRDGFEFKLAKMLHEDHVKNICQLLQSDSFTTEQYRQYVETDMKRKFGDLCPIDFTYPTDLARNCLEGFGVVREVESDLWALLY